MLERLQAWGRDREWENTLSAVSDFLDTQLGPREIAKANEILTATLVDEIKQRVYVSRFRCADTKRTYTHEELEQETKNVCTHVL